MNHSTKESTLRDRLFYTTRNLYETANEEEQAQIDAYADRYIDFLSAAKTEREAVRYAVDMAEAHGYKPYTLGSHPRSGEKYYYNNRGKSIILFAIGTEPLTEGVYLSAAHIDSPRLDLKQCPVYADSGIGYLKTHYYGGIKKYQWATIPLALHGTVTRADGTTVDICIGEDEREPIFYISDLLVHLGKDQLAKTLAEGINGEQLNLLFGSRPYAGEAGEGLSREDRIKLTFLAALYEKYQITEADFLSAELCAVPAGRARYIGLDRSLIGGYGHDDRICAYPALTALFETDDSPKTRMVVLADKEEIGSIGNTGMQTRLFDDIMDDIAASAAMTGAQLRAASKCLSADVGAAFDPNFPEAYERRNSAYLNHGVVMCKYTGKNGKYGSSDASAEFVGYIRSLFARDNIVWQTCELGKIDQGGGGTVAAFIANRNIDVVDLGVPLLSMHAPMEVAASADLYCTHRAFAAFNR